MNRYKVTTERGRLRGAIGAFYPISRYIRANTPEEAEEEFRRDIETSAPPVITLDNYPEYKPEVPTT